MRPWRALAFRPKKHKHPAYPAPKTAFARQALRGLSRSKHLWSAELERARAGAVAIATAIWLISVTTGSVYGQAPAEISGGVVNLGGRGWSPGEGKLVTSDGSASQFEFDVRAGFATDYIYRGTTLSDHKPAVGAAFEAAFSRFYAGVSVASVKLPTQPAAEIALSGGVRPKIGDVDFDFRATYYLYPGEVGMTNGIDYWEAGHPGG
jgi:hypothetical protein